MDIALLALGGVLVGGTWSLWRQDAAWWLVVLVGLLAALSLAASWGAR